jgi:hypothetical protein
MTSSHTGNDITIIMRTTFAKGWQVVFTYFIIPVAALMILAFGRFQIGEIWVICGVKTLFTFLTGNTIRMSLIHNGTYGVVLSVIW